MSVAYIVICTIVISTPTCFIVIWLHKS